MYYAESNSVDVHTDFGDGKAFVFGHQFGPVFVAIVDDLEEAFDEWDERHGTRVDPETDSVTLADYGEDPDEQIENALSEGDIRINDGGTMVWVDHYEWVKEFDNVSDAFAFAFGISK
jgi:hypothetical protein